MPSRRGPRWMFWPGKLLWVPCTVVGAWLAFVTRTAIDPLGGGAFRVGLVLFEPAGWSRAPVVHGLGIVLLLAGGVLFGLYLRTPSADARGIVEEFPLWTLAAWAFFVVAVGASLHWNGHVFEPGRDGLSWRFLLSLRAHPLDRVVALCALLLATGCTVTAYGRGPIRGYFLDEPEAGPETGPASVPAPRMRSALSAEPTES